MFIIATEVLSRGIIALNAEGKLNEYTKPNKCLNITHLVFANDMVIFINGSKNSLRKLMEFLLMYEAESRQLINKCKIFFVVGAKTNASHCNTIAMVIGFQKKMNYHLIILDVCCSIAGRKWNISLVYWPSLNESLLAGNQSYYLKVGRLFL